jgi:hypothetical protein
MKLPDANTTGCLLGHSLQLFSVLFDISCETFPPLFLENNCIVRTDNVLLLIMSVLNGTN